MLCGGFFPPHKENLRVMDKIKLIIDTDIGADVDDAIAIYAATFYKQVELLGITTVFKNVEERGRIAKKLLNLCGFNHIPVFTGSGDRLELQTDKTSHTLMYDKQLENSEYEPQTGGTDFIIECAKKYGKELTILAIGPLTNIALCIKKAPDAMNGVGKIVVMGGAFFQAKPEWNVFCDPLAADVVVKSQLPLYFVGLDVTAKTKLPFHLQEELLSHAKENSALGYVAQLAEKWVDARNCGITLHDLLAFYALVKPDFIHFIKQRIAVETKGEHTLGVTFNYSQTSWYSKDKGNEIYVADCVDEDASVEELFSVSVRV